MCVINESAHTKKVLKLSFGLVMGGGALLLQRVLGRNKLANPIPLQVYN